MYGNSLCYFFDFHINKIQNIFLFRNLTEKNLVEDRLTYFIAVLPHKLKKVAVNVVMFICPSFRLSGSMEERDSHFKDFCGKILNPVFY